MNRKILPICIFAALCVPAFGQASSKDAKIEKLMTSMNIDKQMNTVFTQMKSMVASQLPATATDEQKAKAAELQEKIFNLMQSRMSWEKMRPQYVKLYSDTFSDEEIDGLAAFYESPAGKAMLEKMPVLMAKSMSIAQDILKEIAPQIQQIVKDSLPPKDSAK
jgi:hypothetical protein